MAAMHLDSEFPSSDLFYVLNAGFNFCHYENLREGSSISLAPSACVTLRVIGTNKVVIVKRMHFKEHSFSVVYR